MREMLPCPLSPALLQLLRACEQLGTTKTDDLAKHFCVSPYTVRTNFGRIHAKLSVHSRYEAVKMARDQGWIT